MPFITMSDYCSQCTPFQHSDIDLFRIAVTLKPECSESFLCEGCSNRGLYKDENGLLYLARQTDNGIELSEVKIEDLMKK